MADQEKSDARKTKRRPNHEERKAWDREYRRRLRKEQPERVREAKRRYYERNKEKVKAAAKENRKKHPERRRAYSAWYHRDRFKADPDYHRKRALERRYGITLEAFHQLIEAQGNACAICRDPMDKIERKCVDHCHKTGKVRGVLCQGCNVAIAHLKDDPLIALRASEYLSRHK